MIAIERDAKVKIANCRLRYRLVVDRRSIAIPPIPHIDTPSHTPCRVILADIA